MQIQQIQQNIKSLVVYFFHKSDYATDNNFKVSADFYLGQNLPNFIALKVIF